MCSFKDAIIRIKQKKLKKGQIIYTDDVYLIARTPGGVASLAIKYDVEYNDGHKIRACYKSLLDGKVYWDANSVVIGKDEKKHALVKYIRKSTSKITVGKLQKINKGFIEFQYKQLVKQDAQIQELMKDTFPSCFSSKKLKAKKQKQELTEMFRA